MLGAGGTTMARTTSSLPPRGGWLALKEDPDYQAGLRERYKVEQKFGEAKAFHGLRRCRYLGLARYRLQAYLTALALNLKRSVMPKTALVKLLYGLGFRQPPQRVLQAPGEPG